MAKDKKNPVKSDPTRVEPELETDNFSVEEQEKIVRFIKQDIDADKISMQDWIAQRQKDLQMYEGEAPSVIEDLSKEDWQSDRNMGLCAANCDAYQATLLSTCYNPDTIHYTATEKNDIDHAEQLEQFTKWGLGKQEADFFPQVDDFVHNKITQGISYFYIHWEVKYEWVDRRIPEYDAKGEFVKYRIETEHKRFERGVIDNIPDVSDLFFPAHGDSLQKKQHLIHRVHKTANDILELGEKNVFTNVTEDYTNTLRKYCYDHQFDILGREKAKQLGITKEDDLLEGDLRIFPVDLFNWYGPYEKNGKKEEYRFTIEPETNKFLAGKPLRKITRSGKRPFVGKPFIRRPGFVRGNSLPHLIEDPVNAFNNTYNQKSDFQYVENCPSGWYSPDEGMKEQVLSIKPGTLNPTQNPESIVMPNHTRSLAWASTDFELFFEVIERMTGAASYFQTVERQSKTLGQDQMIASNSETRFGLWVNRIIDDIAEAITMWIGMYQDWSPPDLGERVLGEDGRKLFSNFSIETLRGAYDANITPDIISGSKSLDREIALWGLQTLSMTPWFDPMINPKGSWNLVVNAAKKSGFADIENMMPPEPKAAFGQSKTVKDKWTQLKQGIVPEIDASDDILELYMGMMEIGQEKREDLDPEYRPNLDVFMFRLNILMMKEMQNRAIEKEANQMAIGMVQDVEAGRLKKEKVIDA